MQVSRDRESGEAATRLPGTFSNGGTNLNRDAIFVSYTTHNFRGGGCECKQTLCLSRRSAVRKNTPELPLPLLLLVSLLLHCLLKIYEMKGKALAILDLI